MPAGGTVGKITLGLPGPIETGLAPRRSDLARPALVLLRQVAAVGVGRAYEREGWGYRAGAWTGSD